MAVGEVVGYSSIKSAYRMNGAVVLFLNSMAKVRELVEKGVVIHDTFVPALPLVCPAKRITISNASLFIKNETLCYNGDVAPLRDRAACVCMEGAYGWVKALQCTFPGFL